MLMSYCATHLIAISRHSVNIPYETHTTRTFLMYTLITYTATSPPYSNTQRVCVICISEDDLIFQSVSNVVDLGNEIVIELFIL